MTWQTAVQQGGSGRRRTFWTALHSWASLWRSLQQCVRIVLGRAPGGQPASKHWPVPG